MALGLRNKSRSQLRIFNRSIYIIGILSGFILIIYFTLFFNIAGSLDSNASTKSDNSEQIYGIDENNIISYYNFNKYPVLKSTKGISASSISKYANIKNGGANNTPGLSAGNQSQNINMVFDINPKFNSAGIVVQCSFKKQSKSGSLFKRGKNFELKFSGNDLRIKYSLFINHNNSIKVNERISNVLPKDEEITQIRFLYEPTLGLAVVQINGKNVWKHRTEQNLALDWESTKPFVFAKNINSSSSGEVIFDELIIASTTPPVEMPFELLSFNSTSENNTIVIDWYTNKEIDTDYFIIEKSMDGKKFEEVGRTKAAGSCSDLMNYSLIDQFPNEGITYYRLITSNSSISPSLFPVTAVEYQISNVEAKR